MRNLVSALLLAPLVGGSLAYDAPRTVEVAAKPGEKWVATATRSLADVPGIAELPPDAAIDRFGGLTSRKEKGTGLFHTTKVDGRWSRIVTSCLRAQTRAAGMNCITSLLIALRQTIWRRDALAKAAPRRSSMMAATTDIIMAKKAFALVAGLVPPAEVERSGLSGSKFAALAGIKYQSIQATRQPSSRFTLPGPLPSPMF